MNGGAVYAKILRASLRGRGVYLTAEEIDAAGIGQDDAAIMSAIGGDCDDGPPEWLTATERRRFLAAQEGRSEGERIYLDLFRPGREVLP